MNSYESSNKAEVKERTIVPLFIIKDLELESIYKQYFSFYYHYALKIVGSKEQAEDIVQDVFMKLWERREGSGEILDIKKYLNRMVYNEATNVFRKKWKERVYEDYLLKTFEPGICSAGELVEVKECVKLINAAIDSLPPRRKMVFVLKRMEELSLDEIAEVMEISKCTVKETLNKATKSVMEYFGNIDYSPSRKRRVLRIVEGKVA